MNVPTTPSITPATPSPIATRVLIGEDETIQREGLRRVLTDGGFDVIATAATAPALIELARQHNPDLVVTDIQMPPDNTDDGLRAAIAIRASQPGSAVVVLSQHLQRGYAQELLANGIGGIGYLLKQRIADLDVFCVDLARVAAGGTALDPEVVELMLTRAHRTNPELNRLTPACIEVLALMAQGRSNAAIASELMITDKALAQRIARIYTELQLLPSADDHRRVLAVLAYLNQTS